MSRRRVDDPVVTGSADERLGQGEPVPGGGQLYVGCTAITVTGKLVVVLRLDTTADSIGGGRYRTYKRAFVQFADGRRSSVLADTLELVTSKKEEG